MASLKIIALWAFLVVCWVAAISNAAPSDFVIDDGEAASPTAHVRDEEKYVPAVSGGGDSGKIHFEPVYTFAKIDPKANFKWGVHHRPGSQYGR